MSLSTPVFLFGALPIFLLIYFIAQKKLRIYILLVFSAWFYYVNDPSRLKFIVVLILGNYVLSILIGYFREKEKTDMAKLFLTLGISADLLVLFFYKYLNFAADIINSLAGTSLSFSERTLMMGLSFFTFTLISYLADVYQNKCRLQKNVVKFADYVLMFPKILMGPIIRYDDVDKELDDAEVALSDIGLGAKRFMVGFCKKTIIADNLALLVSEIGTAYASSSVTTLWIGSVGYSLELLFDFAGYSDMAIGLALMLGFHFSENFNYPYCCKSLTDFWRRWHISLSSWLRDYIYIPLGGSRCSAARNIFNLFIVWLVTGLWHGAGYSFIVWGMVYFAMLLVERYIVKPRKLGRCAGIIWRVVTLLVINFNWVIFSQGTLMQGLQYCFGMLGGFGKVLFGAADVRLLREYGLYLVLGILFATPIASVVSKRAQNVKVLSKVNVVVVPILYILAFLWGLSFVVLGSHNPFMYQQF